MGIPVIRIGGPTGELYQGTSAYLKLGQKICDAYSGPTPSGGCSCSVSYEAALSSAMKHYQELPGRWKPSLCDLPGWTKCHTFTFQGQCEAADTPGCCRWCTKKNECKHWYEPCFLDPASAETSWEMN